jgi:hypothetical protein
VYFLPFSEEGDGIVGPCIVKVFGKDAVQPGWAATSDDLFAEDWGLA